MKRILSAILALILSFSMCVIGFAQEDEEILPGEPTSQEQVDDKEDVPEGDPETPENPEEPEEPEDPNAYHVPPATKKNSVARIYLCSKLNKFGKVSHFFIYIENLTDESLKVGLITLEKDQGVSMGAFGLQRSDGWGVYYNTESYRFTETDYSTIVALCEELDSSHLAKLNRFLQNNNHWDLIFNCVFFAVDAWNSCTTNFVFPVFIPLLTRLQLVLRPHTTLTQMYVPARENVYFVKGNGSRAKLQICSDDSVNR